jgi:hypothetical protein
MSRVWVDAEALRQVLNAIGGPAHHIRELVATMSLTKDNPINLLRNSLGGQSSGLAWLETPVWECVLDVDGEEQMVRVFGADIEAGITNAREVALHVYIEERPSMKDHPVPIRCLSIAHDGTVWRFDNVPVAS